MKKILLLLIILLALCSTGAFATESFSPTFTVCNAVTTAAAYCTTAAFDLGFYASKGTCVMTASGTAATSFTVSLYGSIDNTTFAPLSLDGTATTMTYTIASPATNTFSFINQPARYLKGYYASKVGGDGTSAITMKCVAGGN